MFREKAEVHTVPQIARPTVQHFRAVNVIYIHVIYILIYLFIYLLFLPFVQREDATLMPVLSRPLQHLQRHFDMGGWASGRALGQCRGSAQLG